MKVERVRTETVHDPVKTYTIVPARTYICTKTVLANGVDLKDTIPFADPWYWRREWQPCVTVAVCNDNTTVTTMQVKYCRVPR
jgi:hypothetical protein